MSAMVDEMILNPRPAKPCQVCLRRPAIGETFMCDDCYAVALRLLEDVKMIAEVKQ